MRSGRMLLFGLALTTPVQVWGQDVPATSCSGQNCMQETVKPAQDCEGENCAQLPPRGMVDCAGQDCGAIEPGSGPEIETVEPQTPQ